MFRRVELRPWSFFLIFLSSWSVTMALYDACSWRAPTKAIPWLAALSAAGIIWYAARRPKIAAALLAGAGIVLSIGYNSTLRIRLMVDSELRTLSLVMLRLRTLSASALNSSGAAHAQWLVFLFIAILTTSMVQRRVGPFILIVGCLGWFGYLWLSYVDAATFWMCAFLLSSLPLYAIWRSAASGDEDGASGLRSTSLAVTMCAMALSIATVLPRAPEPFDFESASRWMNRQFPALAELRGGSYGRYSLRDAGFGNSEKDLGGPVTSRDEVIARIEVYPDPGTSTYLRSEIWTTYTGRGWTAPLERVQLGRIDPSTVDLVHSLDSGRLFFPPEVIETRLRVQPTLPTDEVLVLTEPVRMYGVFPRAYAELTGTIWQVPRSIQEYSVVSGVPLPPPPPETRRGGFRPPELPDELKPYLQLPTSLPQRVTLLARRTAMAASSPWDAVLRLEQVTRRMPYATNTPATPAGRDFVDYFLNDLRQGYCTYHSSALAVLCRAAGIPSRWVTGYLVPPGSGLRDVNVKNAHAWVEVFIEGHGWQVMEATPPFGVPDRIRPEVTAFDTTPIDDVILGDTASGTISPFADRDMEDEGFYGEALPPEKPYPEMALAFIFLAFMGRTGWCLIDWRRRGIRVTGTLSLYAGLLRLFGVAGEGPRSSETAREYQERLSTEWPEAADLIRDMIPRIEKIYYGGGADCDVSLGHSAWSLGLLIAKRRLGAWRYFFRLYVLNRVIT